MNAPITGVCGLRVFVAALGLFSLLAHCGCATTSTTRSPMDVGNNSIMSDCSFQYSDTVKIHCRTVGERQPALVMLHGFGTSIETWHDVQSLLSPHAALHMLDLKGFGLSSKPSDDRYSPDVQAEIVVDFIRRRSLKEFLLVGHSYGGGIALLAHQKLRERGDALPRGLILIDAAVYEQRYRFS